MGTTDTTEKGLETLIMRHMTGTDGLATGAAGVVAEAARATGGSGWFAGNNSAYDREFAVDAEQLFTFLIATQPEEWAKLGIANYKDRQGVARQRFLARLQGEITRRGTIDVLRNGIKHGALNFDLFYGKPSAENAKAVARHATNRFSITRQLHFSRENKRSLDLCAFINGLPVITFELKNSLTKQTVEDAIEQYKRDRDLPDADAEIEPVPTSGGGRKPESEMDKLSNIVKQFNDMYGGLFSDAKRMEQRITGEIPQKVAADAKYQNAKKNSDRQNAKIEHDKALKRVITAMFKDDAQLFKQFQDNDSFRHWLTDTVFGLTYEE